MIKCTPDSKMQTTTSIVCMVVQSRKIVYSLCKEEQTMNSAVAVEWWITMLAGDPMTGHWTLDTAETATGK